MLNKKDEKITDPFAATNILLKNYGGDYVY